MRDEREPLNSVAHYSDLHTCADGICHHTVPREIHILD